MASKHKNDQDPELAAKGPAPKSKDKDNGKRKKKRKKTRAVEDISPESEAVIDESTQSARKLANAEKYDFTYTQNRELSWLRFDNRVLCEAFDEDVPLFERLKFVSIFFSNLDEFFMVRVGGLSDLATMEKEPLENKGNLTASEQIDVIHNTLAPLTRRAAAGFSAIEAQLASCGVERLRPETLTGEERTFVEQYFHAYLAPVISPLVIDPRHPFPNLRNGALYLVCGLESADEENLLGLIEVPSALNRTVEIRVRGDVSRQAYRYMLLEDVMMTCLDSCFGSYLPRDRAVIRVTRNADIDPDGEGVEEDSDYRLHMKRILKQRLRLQPVRLEVEGHLKKGNLTMIRKALKLSAGAVTVLDIPLDLGYVFAVEDRIPAASRADLLFTPVSPQPSPLFDPDRPVREQVMEGDKLLFYPYESMDPFLSLVHDAAHDPECISLRITLYRVAKQSRLCESLISAAEGGKEVTVLMELRARFDEANNIQWAERLEAAGCMVIYGSEGFKCHSKICQLTYRKGMKLTRITLLGTGNFNEKTAKTYSDFMLMTAHEGIGEDANAFFRNLSLGNLKGVYRYLGVAPASLKPLIMNGLNREIERARAGQSAYVFMKMNSLTDREVIDKIAEASQAGVRVEMIIRGISCLLPDIPGKTENVHIRSIVGRFLEHARVYSFGVEGDMVYLSSADMMTRNTEHRVEIAFPVLDPTCRELVRTYMHMQLADNVKARRLTADGTWAPVPRAEGEEDYNAQTQLVLRAYRRAQEAADERQEEIRAHFDPANVEPNPSAAVVQLAEKLAHEPEGAAVAAEAAGAKAAEATPAANANEKRSDKDKAPEAERAAAQADEKPAPAAAPASTAPAPDVAAAPAEQAAGAPKATAQVAHVEATLIEPEAGGADAEAPRPAAHAAPAQQAPTRKRGRMRTGLALIGLGFKTLFGRGGAPKALEGPDAKRRR